MSDAIAGFLVTAGLRSRSGPARAAARGVERRARRRAPGEHAGVEAQRLVERRRRRLVLAACRERLREADAGLGVRGGEPRRFGERGQGVGGLVQREQLDEAEPPPRLRVLRREPHALAKVVGESIPVLERDQVSRQLLTHRGAAGRRDAERERLPAGGGARRSGEPLAQPGLLAGRGGLAVRAGLSAEARLAAAAATQSRTSFARARC